MNTKGERKKMYVLKNGKNFYIRIENGSVKFFNFADILEKSIPVTNANAAFTDVTIPASPGLSEIF